MKPGKRIRRLAIAAKRPLMRTPMKQPMVCVRARKGPGAVSCAKASISGASASPLDDGAVPGLRRDVSRGEHLHALSRTRGHKTLRYANCRHLQHNDGLSFENQLAQRGKAGEALVARRGEQVDVAGGGAWRGRRLRRDAVRGVSDARTGQSSWFIVRVTFELARVAPPRRAAARGGRGYVQL